MTKKTRASLTALFDRLVAEEAEATTSLAAAERALETAHAEDVAAAAKAIIGQSGAPDITEAAHAEDVSHLRFVLEAVASAIAQVEDEIATMVAVGLDPGASLYPEVEPTSPDARPPGDALFESHESTIALSNQKLAEDEDRQSQRRAYAEAVEALNIAKHTFAMDHGEGAQHRFRASEHLSEEQMQALNPRVYSGTGPRQFESAGQPDPGRFELTTSTEEAAA